MAFVGRTFLINLILLGVFYSVIGEECLECEGYSLKIISIKPCKGLEEIKQVLRVNQSTNVILSSDCRIRTYTCFEWDTFEKAEVKFTFSKNGRSVLKKTVDLCTDQSDLTTILKAFGFPRKCPAETGSKCVNGERAINICNRKSMFISMLSGGATLKFDIQHEDDRKSCYEIDLEVKKTT